MNELKVRDRKTGAKKIHRRLEVREVTDENFVTCVRDLKSRDPTSFLLPVNYC